MTAPVVHHGDCIEVMRGMADNSIDAIVCDPPYGIGFMGKAWDAKFITETTDRRWQYAGDPSDKAGPNGGHRSAAAEAGRYDLSATANHRFQAWCQEWATEALRILKPGGHMLAAGSSRTFHRLVTGVEDAGFEIRDTITWHFGSGFPKSHNVALGIDKAAGATGHRGTAINVSGKGQREDIETSVSAANGKLKPAYSDPVSDEARRWKGWGTALKPATEFFTLARKPLVGTVAGNVIAHGTGALNIDACRIAATDALVRPAVMRTDNAVLGKGLGAGVQTEPAGRWPANVALSEDQAAALDQMSGILTSGKMQPTQPKGGNRSVYGQDAASGCTTMETYGDKGGASRFFYVAKAPAKERPKVDGIAHPTVKPVALMRWLIRLVTPPGGTVLDPFAGSGTTIEAAMLEGFDVIGIEREADYLPLIQARIDRNTYEQPDERYGIDSFTLFDTEGETA